ncbi:MAG: PHP domain-containing protein, partial [Acidobacteria bacterium]|nr:PHP domain-containing protein [Acidobacteriota bacterium]
MDDEEAPLARDSNSLVAAALRDMAAAQDSAQKAWGYKRAAAAVLDLEVPIESLRQSDGSMRKVAHIGPSSTRIILEILDHGRSAIVEAAVAASGRESDVATRHDYRQHFLSRAEVLRALRNPRLGGPRLDQCRGDFHMHSTWSDGADSVAAMAEGCRARGHAYCAITDHSYGLAIARGVSMADLARQHDEIQALNLAAAGHFHIFKGIEANLRADGLVDMTPEELARLDIVVASPHSALRKADDQTERMVRAVTQPGVHILGHPRGRMYGSRPGVTADWPQVFAAAARSEVAIEIDGDPSRQDVDHTLAVYAVAAGCLFTLDSDAHGVDQLAYAETAVAHARLAWVPPDRVVNTWPVEQVRAWAERR